ncbi:MAG: 5-dehydro-4-deoxy-D-glucuronate isomerase [Draconibacterium sp.]|nr:5-dehydro-4-deoxy-D-glucuronate isomerase [Draconibacterium sp.]
MATIYERRYAFHPEDFKSYDTEKIRKEFLVENLMENGNVRLVYSSIERYIVGGAVPVGGDLPLETIEPLKAEYFCERREVGVINVAGSGSIVVDGTEYKMGFKDALYIGKGCKDVVFKSDDATNPAHYYINSAPAHKEFPVKHVTMADANVIHLGALETSNERDINQLLINGVVETCQLQMGMTELKTGSVWNTMPPHLHSRRNEVYFYFNVPEGQRVCHFMGEPNETRHIFLKNEQAVISPEWSIHSAAGTTNYIFIWGMAGENLDYTDMDVIQPEDLR